MFTADGTVLVFDYLRVPYRHGDRPAGGVPDGFAAVSPTGSSERRWLWPRQAPGGPLDRSGIVGEYLYAGSRIFGHVIPDDAMVSMLGAGWHADEAVTDVHGLAAASVWRHESGSICLPFDPAEAIVAFWSEAYHGIRNARHTYGPSRTVRLYYQIRPLVPRSIQIAVRRAYARRSARTEFPRWPFEPALHDLVRNLYRIACEVAGEPVPWIAPWPAPFHWAFVLTHDVETAAGYARIGDLQAIEASLGYRSSWNLVARRYPVEDRLVAELERAGCEVGVHGLYHDGRDLASREMLDARLPEMHEHAARWGAVGFRSPATQRRWDLMAQLDFDYDSSYPDTDPYEPQPGGSCSWLPYHIGDVVELPITLPQDHTLFVILQRSDPQAWIEKAGMLRSRGGMALVLTHPDYLKDDATRQWYRGLLEAFAGDESAWRALPREVSDWWRRRAASELVRDGDGWSIRGPAAEESAITFEAPC